jgi:hypothetical protein
MHRSRNKVVALGTSLAVLAVVGSVPATADPSTTGPLVPVSGASPIAACEGDTGFRDVGGVPATSSSTARSSPT